MMYDQLVENKLMTDNEGEFSADEQFVAHQQNGEASIVSDRHSRKLYVITEESQSNIGPAMSMEDYARASFKN